MGLIDNSKDLAYFGRKLGTKDTKFSLQARNAGRKIVHFYRNDPLTGKYLDDYIEVVILSENGSNKTHIEAPEYKLPVQKKENPVKNVQAVEEEKTETSEKSESTEKIEKSEVAKTSANTKTSAAATSSKTTSNATSATTNAKPAASKNTTSTAATTTAAATTSTATAAATTGNSETSVSDDSSETYVETAAQPSDTSALLKEAQLLYDEKEYKAALNKLNQFFEYSTDKGDEALYLKGQILEAKSDVRDIKGAIDAYTTLTKNYPASKLWDSANKRIIYLKRFYLEVR